MSDEAGSGEEHESSAHESAQESAHEPANEPAHEPAQPNSTAALANAAPAEPTAIVPTTGTPTFVILAGILAVLTLGVVAVAVTWYLLKEIPAKDPKRPEVMTPSTMGTTETTTTTTEKPIVKPKQPLICTYNIAKFTALTVLPTDGLCEAIYLDSECRDVPCAPNSLWTPAGTAVDFLNVAKAARTGGNKTRFGLAFDAHATSGLSIFSATDHRVKITKQLWNDYNVSHYASLNINVRTFTSPGRAALLWTPLLFLKTELTDLPGVNDDFGLVLGVTSTDINTLRAKVLEGINRTTPVWTHMVIISHTSFANYALPPYGNTNFDNTNCLIVPPSIHNYTGHYNQTYYSSLEDSWKFLEYLRNMSGKPVFPIAVSVTLKGSRFRPADPINQNLELYKKCMKFNETEHASPYVVCNANTRGAYNYSTAYKSEYFIGRSRVFTFDMEKSLQSKLCEYKDKFKDLAFGIAVYDIDADGSTRACPTVKYTGRYNRLAFLRNLRDFMDKYTNKTDCLSVQ